MPQEQNLKVLRRTNDCRENSSGTPEQSSETALSEDNVEGEMPIGLAMISQPSEIVQNIM